VYRSAVTPERNIEVLSDLTLLPAVFRCDPRTPSFSIAAYSRRLSDLPDDVTYLQGYDRFGLTHSWMSLAVSDYDLRAIGERRIVFHAPAVSPLRFKTSCTSSLSAVLLGP
jgi:hypothetical protein